MLRLNLQVHHPDLGSVDAWREEQGATVACRRRSGRWTLAEETSKFRKDVALDS